MPASPQVLLTPTGASSLIGATQQVTLSFSNAGTNAGYAPFIVLDLPPGADGYDGVTLISATYLGATVDTTIVTYDLAGNATNPLTGQIITGTPGAQAAILSLPFGSFSPGQTAADVLLTLDTDSFADNAAPLTLEAQGGFAFGNDPLNNPGADPVVLGPVNAVTITPVIALLDKTYLGPEQETATGPSYVRQWDVVGTIANGQTLSGYTITDTLPNGVVVNSAFTAAISTNLPATITVTAGALGTTIVTAVFTAPVIGGVDVPTLEIPFWVNQAGTGGGPILGATNGAFATLTNSANYTGNWDPLDPADPVTVVTGVIAETDTITAKSIAEQKGVTVVGGGLPTPGQTLEYTLAGQISDYFDIGTLVLTDTLGDGQTFQAGFTPVITLTENGVSVTQPLIASEYTVGPKVNGVTTITFDVSEATARLGFGATLAGTGEIAPNAATATVTFRATVDADFTGPVLGDVMVDQGDTLANGIVFSGTTPSLDPVADDSAASVTLPTNQVSKSIAFINGAAVVGPQTIQAGDLITYHLRLDMPLTHTHSITLHDFLPLPVFLATDPDANGVANGFTWNGALYDGMPPAVNNAEIGPNTTTPLVLINTPTITQNAGSNSVTFNFGSIIDGYMPSTLDLLFTVRVRDALFGDGLLLTNQVTSGELNSQNAPFAANAIVQFTLGEPRLDITKGVVSTNGQGSFTGPTGPVVFAAPGVGGPAFGGTINSTNLAITPVDANLAAADGGDLVKFAIVVDNVGSGPRGAFDVLIRDTLPAGFATPGGLGLNIRVTDGAGNPLAFTNVGGGLFDPLGGIQLTDPSLNQGALARDNATSGADIVVITYDLQVENAIQSPVVLTNVATVANYAAIEGGVNHTGNDGLPDSDDATVFIAPSGIVKTVVSTSAAHTGTAAGNAGAPDLTIGELITWNVTVTISEGVSRSVILRDLLPGAMGGGSPGLFELISVSNATLGAPGLVGPGLPAGLTSPVVSDMNGDTFNDTVTFTLGDITNTPDGVVNAADTISFTLTARVKDLPANFGGLAGFNLAEVSLADPNNPGGRVTTQATSPFDIVEPNLSLTKAVNDPTPAVGDTVTYTLVLTNNASSHSASSFDNLVQDALAGLPPTVVFQAGSVTAVNSGAYATSIVTGNVLGDSGVNVTTTRLDPGQNLTVTFQAVVADLAAAGAVVNNTATAGGSTLPGTPVDERSYAVQASAQLVLERPGITKAVFASSEPSTAGSSLAIGEIVTYRFTVSIPDGTSNSLTLIDDLPDAVGLGASGRLQFISAAVVSAGADLIGGALLLNPTVTATDFNGLNGSAERVTLNFGNVVNTPVNLIRGPQDQLVVELQARVIDVPANENGDTLINTVEIFANGLSGGTATAPVAIIVPELDIQKSTTFTTGDAGDVVTYTLSIGHTANSAATAFNLNIADTLPAGVMLVAGSLGTNFGTVAQAGNGITLTAASLALGGGPITVTYQARLVDAVFHNQSITNVANLAYTTLPGGGRALTDSDDATVGVRIIDTLDKTQVSTSLPATLGSDLAVGETVTYRLTATLNEGTQRLQLADALPAGLTYVSASVVSLGGGNITASLPGAPVFNGGTNSVSFDFGTVVNPGDNLENAGDQVVVEITARVNGTALPAGTTLTDTGTLTAQTPGGMAMPTLTDTVTNTVVAPLLNITKATPFTVGDAGDVATYALTIAHEAGSTASAYNLVLNDLIPAGLTLVGVPTTTAGTLTTPGGNSIALSLSEYALGAPTITITYQARLANNVINGQVIPNTATLNYASAPTNGTALNDSASDSVAVAIVDSLAKSIASTSFPLTLGTGVGIGEIITYRLTATLAEGAQHLVLTDAMPAGLTFLSASVLSLGGGNITTALPGTPVFNGGTNTVSFDFGNIINPGDNLSNAGDQIVVEVVAQVAPGAMVGTNLINTGTLTPTLPSGTPFTGTPMLPVTSTQAVTVLPTSTINGVVGLDALFFCCGTQATAVFEGVTVNLLDQLGNIISSTLTDVNGAYSIPATIGGIYDIQFVAPSGLVFAPVGSPGLLGVVNDASAAGLVDDITVTPGPVNGIDAGLLYSPIVGLTGNAPTYLPNGGGTYNFDAPGVYAIGGTGGGYTLNGNGAQPYLVGGTGNNILHGGNGNGSILVGGPGQNIFEGTPGADIILFCCGGGNGQGLGGNGQGLGVSGGLFNGNACFNFDLMVGGSSRDIIEGNDGNVVALGGAGNDEIHARGLIVGGTNTGTITSLGDGNFGNLLIGDTIKISNGPTRVVYQQGDGVQFVENFIPSRGDTIEIYGFGAPTATGIFNGWGVLYFGPNQALVINGWQPQNGPLAGLNYFAGQTSMSGAFGRFNPLPPVVLPTSQTSFYGTQGDDIAIGSAVGTTFRGNGGNDLLVGGNAADIFFGGAGNDSFYGGGGNDQFNLGAGSDQVSGCDGTDVAILAINQAQATIVNNADGSVTVITPTGRHVLTGVEYLRFNDATVNISGVAQPPLLLGTAGADVFNVTNAGTIILDSTAGDDDQAYVSVNGWTASPYIEIARLTGTATIITGNDTGMQIVANPAFASNLTGGAGADMFWGSNNNGEVMRGGGGDDVFRSGTGTTTMFGGTGNDQFVINNAASIVIENAGEGVDTAWVNVNGWTMGAHVEIGRLSGTATMLTGNNTGGDLVANALLGSTILGGSMATTFWGGSGTDNFTGGAGDDIFRSGTGVTTMTGGLGNDQYVINNAADVVNEAPGGGTDTMWVNVNGVTLAANVEIGRLAGTATQLTGAASSNQLVANPGLGSTLVAGTGTTALWGGTGADTMVSSTTNQQMYLYGGADVIRITGPWGIDEVADFSGSWGDGDRVNFQGSGITGIGQLVITDFGDKTLVQSGANQLILYGVGSLTNTLTAGDFIF